MMIKTRHFISLAFLLANTAASALPAEHSSLLRHNELMRLIMGLLCVLLIITCLSWIVKRLHGVKFSSSQGFQSIASMTLGPKEKIILLKVGNRYLLMGLGSSTVSLVYDFGDQVPPGFDSENKPAFAELLKSAVRKK